MAISLHGVALFPSDVSRTSSKIGKPQISANGSRVFIHRTSGGVPIVKDEITLSFKGVSAATRAAIEALSNVTTTMIFVDDTGASYTCQCEDGAYEQNIAIIGGATALTLRYDCSLKLFES